MIDKVFPSFTGTIYSKLVTARLITWLLDYWNTKITRFAHHHLQISVRVEVSYRYNHKKIWKRLHFIPHLGNRCQQQPGFHQLPCSLFQLKNQYTVIVETLTICDDLWWWPRFIFRFIFELRFTFIQFYIDLLYLLFCFHRHLIPSWM